jgi:hypothetical protein
MRTSFKLLGMPQRKNSPLMSTNGRITPGGSQAADDAAPASGGRSSTWVGTANESPADDVMAEIDATPESAIHETGFLWYRRRTLMPLGKD